MHNSKKNIQHICGVQIICISLSLLSVCYGEGQLAFIKEKEDKSLMIPGEDMSSSLIASSQSGPSKEDLLNPIRNKAQNYRAIIEHLKEVVKEKQSNKKTKTLAGDIEILLKQAEEKASAFEKASSQHDKLMRQYKTGGIESGYEAIRLAQNISQEEHYLDDILFRIQKITDSAYANVHTSSSNSSIGTPPSHHSREETLPPHPKSPPPSIDRFKKEDEDSILTPGH